MRGIQLQCDECKSTFECLKVVPMGNRESDFKFRCPNCAVRLQYPLIYAGRGYILHSLCNTSVKFRPLYAVLAASIFLLGIILDSELLMLSSGAFSMISIPIYIFRASHHCYPVVCGKAYS